MADKMLVLLGDALNGPMLLGEVEISKEEVKRKIADGEVIEVLDCFTMLTAPIFGENPGAFAVNTIVMPLTVGPAAVTVHTKATVCIFTDQTPEMQASIRRLYDQRIDGARIERSGLVMPKGGVGADITPFRRS